jgi:biotin carboxyl carrier protein
LEGLRALAGTAPIVYRVEVDGHASEVELLPDGTLRLDGQPVGVDIADSPCLSVYSVLIDGASHEVYVDRMDGTYLALVRGRVHRVQVMENRSSGSVSTTAEVCGPSSLCAPLCGLVVDVSAAEGDVVEKGQTLVVVESMKMEIQVRSERAGRVREVRVKPGAVVREREVLAIVD